MHLKHLERTYAETKSDLTKVQLSRTLEPSSIAKASDSIILCASDVDKVIYSITLEMDGVAVKVPLRRKFIGLFPPNSVAEYRVLFIFPQKTEQQTFHPNIF